jgi:hypothetical protein
MHVYECGCGCGLENKSLAIEAAYRLVEWVLKGSLYVSSFTLSQSPEQGNLSLPCFLFAPHVRSESPHSSQHFTHKPYAKLRTYSTSTNMLLRIVIFVVVLVFTFKYEAIALALDVASGTNSTIDTMIRWSLQADKMHAIIRKVQLQLVFRYACPFLTGPAKAVRAHLVRSPTYSADA